MVFGSGANGLNVFENSSKNYLFSVFCRKNQFFLIIAQKFCFFRFMTHIQAKKIQLAEYDNVGMFSENLVEVPMSGGSIQDFFSFEFIQKIFNLNSLAALVHFLYF
jgi:hypothetical protein